jgi:hypothetical protein
LIPTRTDPTRGPPTPSTTSPLGWAPFRPTPAEAEPRRRASPPVDAGRLALIRGVHTAAWFSIEFCVGYLLWSGATGRSDRRAAVAAAVVAGELPR